MKRTVAVVLMLVMLTVCASAALAADGLPQSGAAFVHNPDPTDRLNLRAEPRQSALSLGKYYSGTVVDLLGEERGGYVKVRIGQMEGWMDPAYLVASDLIYHDALPVTSVSASSANLRSQPSYDAKVLCTFSRNTPVSVQAVRDDGWLHVIAGGQAGFMRANLLSGTFSYHKGESGQSGGQSGGQTMPGGTGTVYVKSDDLTKRLNLRGMPSGEGVVLGKYYSGTAVELLEEPKDGWVRVRIGGSVIGYMQTKYLTVNGESVLSGMLTRTIRNTSGTGLNLRERPDTASRSLGLYRNGTQVVVFGVYGGWVHVIVDGKVGFMQADKFDTDKGMTYEAL